VCEVIQGSSRSRVEGSYCGNLDGSGSNLGSCEKKAGAIFQPNKTYRTLESVDSDRGEVVKEGKESEREAWKDTKLGIPFVTDLIHNGFQHQRDPLRAHHDVLQH
jgi:hypothetical protein